VVTVVVVKCHEIKNEDNKGVHGEGHDEVDTQGFFVFWDSLEVEFV